MVGRRVTFLQEFQSGCSLKEHLSLLSPAVVTGHRGDSDSHGTLANICSFSLSPKRNPSVTTSPLNPDAQMCNSTSLISKEKWISLWFTLEQTWNSKWLWSSHNAGLILQRNSLPETQQCWITTPKSLEVVKTSLGKGPEQPKTGHMLSRRLGCSSWSSLLRAKSLQFYEF